MIELQHKAFETTPQLSTLAGLAISPQAQRLGYDSKPAYFQDRDRTLAVLEGTMAIGRLAADYAKSYRMAVAGAGRRPTLLQYRDYVFAYALGESIANTQYRPNQQVLTPHAAKVWTHYQYHDLWPGHTGDLFTEPRLTNGWGPLGSVAFYCYYLGSNDQQDPQDWLSLLRGCLRFVWAMVGHRYEASTGASSPLVPNQRLTDLVETKVGLNRRRLDLFKEVLEGYWDHPDVVPQLRQQGLLVRPDQIKQRLLLGQYSERLWSILFDVAPPEIGAEFEQVATNLLGVLKPGGIRLLLQATIVECLLEIGEVLTQQTTQGITRLEAVSSEDAVGRLAGLWATIADARYAQNYFESDQSLRLFTESNENLRLWVRRAEALGLPPLSLGSSPYRLSFFVD